MSEKHFISIENMGDEDYTPPLGFTRDEIIRLDAIYNVVASKDCVAEKGCLYVVKSGLPLGKMVCLTVLTLLLIVWLLFMTLNNLS